MVKSRMTRQQIQAEMEKLIRLQDDLIDRKMSKLNKLIWTKEMKENLADLDEDEFSSLASNMRNAFIKHINSVLVSTNNSVKLLDNHRTGNE